MYDSRPRGSDYIPQHSLQAGEASLPLHSDLWVHPEHLQLLPDMSTTLLVFNYNQQHCSAVLLGWNLIDSS